MKKKSNPSRKNILREELMKKKMKEIFWGFVNPFFLSCMKPEKMRKTFFSPQEEKHKTVPV